MEGAFALSKVVPVATDFSIQIPPRTFVIMSTPPDTVEILRNKINRSYDREFQGIRATQWETTTHRTRALNACKGCRKESLALLDSMVAEWEAPIAMNAGCLDACQQVQRYVEVSLGGVYDHINNAILRWDYIRKIKSLIQPKLMELSAAAARNSLGTIERIAQEASAARNTVLELTRQQSNATAQMFARELKTGGLPWETLVEKYTTRVAHAKNVPVATIKSNADYMSEVYQLIVNSSGRHNPRVSRGIVTNGFISGAMVIVFLAVTILDMAMSPNMVHAFRSASVASASFITGILFERAAASAIHSSLIAAGVGHSMATGLAVLGSIVGSLVVGAVIGLAVGALFNLVVGLCCGNEIPARLRSVIVADLEVPLQTSIAGSLTASLIADLS